MTTYKKTTTKKKKTTSLCHECVKDFAQKDLYIIPMHEYYVRVCLNCLKILEPKDWERIKKECDDFKKTKKP